MATVRTRRPSAPAERLIAEVLAAQGEFFKAIQRPSEEFLRKAIDLPATFDPLDAETIRQAQLAYQRMFQERSAERLRTGMRKAMALPTRLTLIRALRKTQRESQDADVKVRLEQEIERRRREPDPRREAVAKLLEQERRLARAHAAAMLGRARAASRSVQVKAESPTGAYWRRNPESNSCQECIFLDGKLWPWEVLEQIGPPRHPNCQCSLIPVGAARYQGFVGPTAKVPTAKQGIHRARRLLQETIEGAILVEAVDRGMLTEAFGLRRAFHEVDVLRDPFGRFDDKPGASVGHRSAVVERPVPETRIARTYAQAAEMLAEGYAEKVDRKLEEALAGMASPEGFEFLNSRARTRSGIEGTLTFNDNVGIDIYGWDTGDTKFAVQAFGEHGRMRDASDPDLRKLLVDDLHAIAAKFKEPMLAQQRKNIRGAIMSRMTDRGRDAYTELAEAQDENAREPGYEALRQRFHYVPERIIVVDEKGYGRFPLGVRDVMVTAARNVEDHNVTTVNGLAISVKVDLERKFGKGGPGSREVQLHPGTDHITVRSTPALLRHEWGHGLYHALTPEQREDFVGLLPGGGTFDTIDWDGVAKGLSKYAAGDETSRAAYAKGTSQTGAYGYSTETFAEAVALTGGSDYVPEQWPEWVQEVGEWIERLEP